VADETTRRRLAQVEELIRAEVNVKEVAYPRGDDLFIQKRVKPNFVVLGKRLGGRMKAVAARLTGLGQDEIRQLEREGALSLALDGENLSISLAEVEVLHEDLPGWMVASRGPLTVALDVTVTEELEHEGHARELVNRIQRIRKESGFALTDRIRVRLSGSERILRSIPEYMNYICAEILADGMEIVPELGTGVDVEVDEEPMRIQVSKIG
jgi:isoleucyl-tRNA synthetase